MTLWGLLPRLVTATAFIILGALDRGLLNQLCWQATSVNIIITLLYDGHSPFFFGVVNY